MELFVIMPYVPHSGFNFPSLHARIGYLEHRVHNIKRQTQLHRSARSHRNNTNVRNDIARGRFRDAFGPRV